MTSPRTSKNRRPVLSAFLALAIAVFFSLFAAGGATAGEGNGNGNGQGNGQGSEKSEQAKQKSSGGGGGGGGGGGTASSSAQKAPDQTPNDHPSGKDRFGSAGGSGTQGKSTSDPDGMSNGGADKPGGTGGFDADKDGNNGCGNDDDFEDDNNGWCGGKPKVKGSNVDRDIEEEDDAIVLGVTFERKLAQVAGSTQVLGAEFTRSAPTTLAATGAGRSLSAIAALALAMVTAGIVMTLAANRPVAVRTTK